MPIAYHPQDFWTIVFSFTTSSLGERRVWERTLTLLPPAVGFACLNHFFFEEEESARDWDPDRLIMPFGFLVAVITSFRLSDAFQKYERAAGLLTEMHCACRTTTSRLCAYLTPGSEEAAGLALQIRRLIILGCVLIKEFVRGEKSDLELEQQQGLLTEAERKMLVSTVCTIAPASGNGKKDRYPSKNRPAFAFQQAQLLNATLHRLGHYSVPHTYMAVDAGICQVADIYEEVEHFGDSVLPLHYAQFTRMIALIFLLLVPLSLVREVGWGVVPVGFFANLVYFLVDEARRPPPHSFCNRSSCLP